MEKDNIITDLENDIKRLEEEKRELLRQLFQKECYDFNQYKSFIRDVSVKIHELKIILRLEKRKMLDVQKDVVTSSNQWNITFSVGENNI